MLEHTTRVFNYKSYVLQMIQTVHSRADSPTGLRKLYNLRRHFRSQVYCAIATVSGAYIFIKEYRSWPIALLHHWSPSNLVLFTIAVTYWLVTCVEDLLASEEVSSQLTVLPGEKKENITGGYLTGLFTHHFVTLFAYMWSISTKKLGGLCVIGLLFEAPVLLMNFRDIAAAFEEELDYPYQRLPRWKFTVFNIAWMLVFHLCRTMFCLLWPISLIIWRPQLRTLPMGSQIIYHYLGASFNIVAFTLIANYVHRYMLEDMVRMKIISRERFWQLMKVDQAMVARFLLAEEAEEKRRGLPGSAAEGSEYDEVMQLHDAPTQALRDVDEAQGTCGDDKVSRSSSGNAGGPSVTGTVQISQSKHPRRTIPLNGVKVISGQNAESKNDCIEAGGSESIEEDEEGFLSSAGSSRPLEQHSPANKVSVGAPVYNTYIKTSRK